MGYYADKPATIISTNSMFILDEYKGFKSVQVGGTYDIEDNTDDALNYTYLLNFVGLFTLVD